MTLSDAELDRYARHIVLPQVGGVGQRRLKASKVAIVGAGGIGSAVLPALAAAGVGSLTIIDPDVVELEPPAAVHIWERDAGDPKADLALQSQRLNHFVEAQPVQHRITADNAEHLLKGQDLVIDGATISRRGLQSATRVFALASG